MYVRGLIPWNWPRQFWLLLLSYWPKHKLLMHQDSGPRSHLFLFTFYYREHSGSMVECLTRQRHCVVSLSKTHLSMLSTGSTQEDPSRHNWKIVDWEVKNQIKQTKPLIIIIHQWQLSVADSSIFTLLKQFFNKSLVFLQPFLAALITTSNSFARGDTGIVIDSEPHLSGTCKTSLLFAPLAVCVHTGCSAAFRFYTPTKPLIRLNIKYKIVLTLTLKIIFIF